MDKRSKQLLHYRLYTDGVLVAKVAVTKIHKAGGIAILLSHCSGGYKSKGKMLVERVPPEGCKGESVLFFPLLLELCSQPSVFLGLAISAFIFSLCVGTRVQIPHFYKTISHGTSQVVQWLRFCLPMQGCRFHAWSGN